MALQNRVNPFGEIVATRARGTFMGNRGGCFHDDSQRLTKARWATHHWIACVLEFKGRHRTPMMAPSRYTELFFLDEATALAAGHRPCFECRRADALRFFEAMRKGIPGIVRERERLSVEVVDRRLHAERVDARSKLQRTWTAPLGGLPHGTMITLPGDPATPLLWWERRLYPWRFEGYGAAFGADDTIPVTVLTPPTIVVSLEAGYVPAIHPSAH